MLTCPQTPHCELLEPCAERPRCHHQWHDLLQPDAVHFDRHPSGTGLDRWPKVLRHCQRHRRPERHDQRHQCSSHGSSPCLPFFFFFSWLASVCLCGICVPYNPVISPRGMEASPPSVVVLAGTGACSATRLSIPTIKMHDSFRLDACKCGIIAFRLSARMEGGRCQQLGFIGCKPCRLIQRSVHFFPRLAGGSSL